MTTHVRWVRGGEASIVSVDDAAVVLRSTVPAPPGSRLEGVLAGEPPERLQLKVHASKRQDAGDYLVSGRLVDATKAVRHRVLGLAGGTAKGESSGEG